MKKYIVKILAIVVLITSMAVMTGWVLDIAALKSILPQWVTMKFTTALSFFFSGAILYSLDKNSKGEAGWTEIALPVSSLIILLLMISLLASVLFGIRTGIEDLFVKEMEGAVATAKAGQPSIGTMVNFILIALTGISVMTKSSNLKLYTFISGLIVTAIGSLALVGYLINAPILYYTLEGVSSAMAVHTAIMFVLIGFGFIFLGKTKHEVPVETPATPQIPPQPQS